MESSWDQTRASLKAEDKRIAMDKIRRLFPELDLSDEELESYVELYKTALNLGVDPKRLLQDEMDKIIASRRLPLSNIGYPIQGCKFGYYYGSHPDATDEQLAARMRPHISNAPSSQISGSFQVAANAPVTPPGTKPEQDSSKNLPDKEAPSENKDRKNGERQAPSIEEPDPQKELVPDKSHKLSYDKNSIERKRDIERIRDMLLAEAGSPDEMEAIAACVLNRFQTPKENFNVKYPQNYSAIIDAPGQFQGFSGGAMHPYVQKRKDEAKAGDPKAVAKLEKANEIAEKAVDNPDSIERTIADKDGKKHYVYYFMTKGSKPKGHSKKIDNDVYGNDYFYHAK